MKGNTLYDGIRIKVWKMDCGDNKHAGGYKVEDVHIFSTRSMIELGLGQPFEIAYREAELLAIILDAELELNGKIIRKSIRGEYFGETFAKDVKKENK